MQRFLFSFVFLSFVSLSHAQTIQHRMDRDVPAPKVSSIETVIITFGFEMSPNAAPPGTFVTDSVFFSGSVKSCGLPVGIFLRRNASIIPATLIGGNYPDTMVLTFQIPSDADTGAYNLFISAGDSCMDSLDVPSAFTVGSSAGVAENNAPSGLISSFRVSPNPAQDFLSISFTMNAPSHAHLWIYDELGRTVATLCDRTIEAGEQNFEWVSQNVPAGSYFYELTAGEEMYGGRIVVQH